MKSTGQKRRFPPPWKVEQTGPDAFIVQDANGVRLATVYCRDDLHQKQWADYLQYLTADEARRIAKGIARLPEFLMHHPGFYSRDGGDFRWKRSHPYNVALKKSYVQEHWSFIHAVCHLNDIPYDPTGQRIERDGISWTVYEFALQLHAIQFWLRFEGRWMRHNEFIYPDPPNDLPKLKEPVDIYKFGRRPPNR